MDKNEKAELRLESIINILIEFSRGNFDVREEVTEEEDPLNMVISGLNMLGEELSHYKKAINEQSDFLKNILKSIDEIIYAREIVHDQPTQSPFIFISERVEDIVGLTPSELEADPAKWTNAIHSEDRDQSMGAIQAILEGKEMVFSYRIYHPVKKQYCWLEDRVVPKKNEQGIVTHIYGSARDISEEKNNTIELQQKNELVSRLIASSDQFFYIISLDPNDSFTNNFSYHSWQIEKIQGSTSEDLKNNRLGWLKSIHPDDIEQVKKDNRTLFSTKQPVTRIYRVKHARTHEYIWLEDYVVPVLDEAGYIRELYGSARDVSNRKKVKLQQEKLITELSNRHNELMQFNYIVSHNLRAPVSQILGLAQLLNSTLSEEERETTLNYILEAAGNMDELLHDLNTILSTRSTLNDKKELFLLSDIVFLTSSNLAREIEATGTKIETEIHDDANTITSIKSYLQSAIFNLVANAIKYRSEDRAPVIRILAEKSDEKIIISVSDNGMGIDMKTNSNRIFGLYSKLNTNYEGKGLGLYMTKTQIESLGGSITASSTEGVGTTFTITL